MSKLVLGVLLGTLVAATAALADKSIDHQNACTDKVVNLTAAFRAKDWPAVERLADVYLRECRDVADSDSIANTDDFKATSQIERGMYAAALKTSEACIEAVYRDPGCHVRRAEALARLGRTTEARAEFDRAVKVADAAITSYSQRLESRGPERSELDRAERFRLESALDRARSVKELAIAWLERGLP